MLSTSIRWVGSKFREQHTKPSQLSVHQTGSTFLNDRRVIPDHYQRNSGGLSQANLEIGVPRWPDAGVNGWTTNTFSKGRIFMKKGSA